MFVYLAGFSTCKSDLCGCRRPPFSVYSHSLYLRTGSLMSMPQAVKDVGESRSTIIDIFEHMESFFLRLETYVEVQPTTEMRDIIIKILVEVLSILAMATKEIKRYRISGLFLFNRFFLLDQTTQCSEKYLRKLIGKTDIEDALTRLDKLTQEEARMATTQVLKTARSVEDRVRRVDDRVAGVDGRVKAIDRNVVKIIDGKQATMSQSKKSLILTYPDGNKAKEVMQQTAEDVHEAKRSLTYLISSDAGASSISTCRESDA